MSKPFFKPTTSRPDFIKFEKRLLKWWYQSGLIKKYLQKNSKSQKRFSFFDGPITANNPMGVHHAWGRTYKDLWQRFFNMKGFKQRFQNGFDCQGLWVEVEVEKEFGFNSKKSIEKFGIDKFTNACKARVDKYANIQTEQSKRLGMFMDWDNSYFTNSETNNLYIWHFLKIVHQKGWLYKGKSSATWCPRCETGLSQHEQADGYKEVSDTSAYLKFKLKDRKNEFVLAWTTTPWTLSANVLLAVSTKFDYVKVKSNGDTLYLAKESANRLGFKDQKGVNPKTLLGLEYESLYDIPAQKGVVHKIVEWDLVDPAEGTGIVHVAPGCGQEDYELGKKLNVAMISPLDETGHFIDGFGHLSGKYAHDVANEVIDYLKEKDALLKTETVKHRYPHCWRCGTKCLFRLEDDWFINCTELKPQLKKRAKEANWMPKFAGKRMQNWLDNMEDWMISRKRYYGLSLPFYECKCGRLTVVGSKEELKKLAVEPKKVDKLSSLHRPWIDKILIKCPKCGKKVKRIPDVGDCWLDAGVIPFSTLKYFEDKAYWRKWFPAEFICEMIEQIRLWYYSMLVYGAVLENKVPYLNVLNFMEVRSEKGERMSKTKQTALPFDTAVEKMGADVMRWLYLSQNPALNLNFGFRIGDEARRKFHLLLWNVYNFLVTYANIDNWQPKKSLPSKPTKLDLWILTRLDEVIIEVTESLNDYNAHLAVQIIENFVQDLSIWYLRRSRARVGPIAKDKKDKNLAHSVLYLVLVTLTKVLAPFTPYLAEEIYQNLVNGSELKVKDSIHLTDWPEVRTRKVLDQNLLEEMLLVRKICELGHSARKKAKIRVRQPLQSIKVKTKSKKRLSGELVQVIKEELNVKEIVFSQAATQKDDLEVELETKITSQLKAEGETRELIRKIQQLRKEANCELDEKVVVVVPRLPQKKELIDHLQQATLAAELRKGKKLAILKAR